MRDQLTRADELAAAAMTRRRFSTGVGASAALALTGTLAGVSAPAAAEGAIRESDDLFALGVASGDPVSDGVVIWTRLAPRPFEPYGGMQPDKATVEWQVSEDEQFRRIVRQGKVSTGPEYAHSVHVDVSGLRSWRHYYYRFRAGGQISPVGRTRTAPDPRETVDAISIALASCQKWDDGLYHAHRDIAERDHDLVLFVGDYIYEKQISTDVREGTRPDIVDRETRSLDEYRLRYGLYKMDPFLQAAHAASPWVVTMDDHEVEDDWAGEHSMNLETPEFMVRRANALRAYWEHMPLRLEQMPRGPDMDLYRRVRYGGLADFFVMDTRQYRSEILSDGDWVAPDDESRDPSRTITGDAQEEWLLDRCGGSDARWRVLVQQVVMAHLDRLAGPGKESPMATWDGYSASRDRILGGLVDRGVDNLVVLTGDIHHNFVGDLKLDFDDEDSDPVGSEFITTSITSKGDGQDTSEWGRTVLSESPHMKFHNDQRGYVSCQVTPDFWTSEYRVVDRVSDGGGAVDTRARFLLEEGVPGVFEE